MKVLSPYVELEVGAAEAVSLEQLAGWTLSSENSRLWLTEESCARDVWLMPGERHVITGAGKVVIEPWAAGEKQATVRLAPPAASLVRSERWPGLGLGDWVGQRVGQHSPALSWAGAGQGA